MGGVGGVGSDLMRLVCGLRTLRLFKASLKISGCCYYMSKEEEMLAWRSQPGELLCSHSGGWTSARTASECKGCTREDGVPGDHVGPGVDGREEAGPGCQQ